MGNGNGEQRALELDLPPWGRVLVRILFREGPMVILCFVMAGVILGIIPSPYLGDKLDAIKQAHDIHTKIMTENRDEQKATHEEVRGLRRDVQDMVHELRVWRSSGQSYSRRGEP